MTGQQDGKDIVCCVVVGRGESKKEQVLLDHGVDGRSGKGKRITFDFDDLGPKLGHLVYFVGDRRSHLCCGGPSGTKAT
jgi:hypothetical protein